MSIKLSLYTFFHDLLSGTGIGRSKLTRLIIEKYHNLFTWQEVVKCQECGKKIGVCGVSYGTDKDC